MLFCLYWHRHLIAPRKRNAYLRIYCGTECFFGHHHHMPPCRSLGGGGGNMHWSSQNGSSFPGELLTSDVVSFQMVALAHSCADPTGLKNQGHFCLFFCRLNEIPIVSFSEMCSAELNSCDWDLFLFLLKTSRHVFIEGEKPSNVEIVLTPAFEKSESGIPTPVPRLVWLPPILKQGFIACSQWAVNADFGACQLKKTRHWGNGLYLYY